jgi:hypothetical protein
MMRRPAGLLHGNFLDLDFSPPSGISFFREKWLYSHAHGNMIADNMEKEITINHGRLARAARADESEKISYDEEDEFY